MMPFDNRNDMNLTSLEGITLRDKSKRTTAALTSIVCQRNTLKRMELSRGDQAGLLGRAHHSLEHGAKMLRRIIHVLPPLTYEDNVYLTSEGIDHIDKHSCFMMKGDSRANGLAKYLHGLFFDKSGLNLFNLL